MVEVLHVTSITVDKFKSFKHVSMLFNKGFNCIVGPNGSGKSNIIDALLFCLGESSLRRLRVDRLQYLIREGSARRSAALGKAHVKIELDGDEKLEVIRGIRADGKTVYRLNGKRMTRQEVIEVMKRHMVHIDETSTIAQGEINKIIEANAKQRREFIDIAAGIQEFEYKKKEALGELEKVATKISTAQAMLNERLTYLNELAKDKDTAEKYLEMNKRLKSLNYSVLVKKRKSSQAAIEGYVRDIAKLELQKNAVAEKLAEHAKRIAALSEERQGITAMLSEGTNLIDGVNKKLADVSNELSALEVRIGTSNGSIEETARLIASLGEQMQSTDATIKENGEELDALSKRIAEAEAEAKRFNSGGSGADTGKRVKELEASIAGIEKEAQRLQEMLAKLQTDKKLADAGADGVSNELAKLGESLQHELALAEELKAKVKETSSKKEQAEKRATELRDRGEEVRNQLDSVSGEITSLKEQRAFAHSRDGAQHSKLAAAFGGNPGFHGSVAELCSYDSRYAEAVEAAAGSRFNYYVVDSIDVANEVIQFLKKQNLGRATFVPLQELSVESEHREKGLQALADLLEYERRFEKVFAYIFSNTYLVNDVEEAKRLGVGKRRYVTLGGETVEKSGVLSGGSRAKVLPLAAIEKKLRELEASSAKLFAEGREIDAKYFTSRKDSAAADLELASLNAGIEESNRKIKEYGTQKGALTSRFAEMQKESMRLGREAERVGSEFTQASQKVATAKRELSLAYEDTLQAAKKGMKKEEMEQLNALNKSLEEHKFRSAQLQQAVSMLKDGLQQKRSELKEKKSLLEKTKKALADDAKRKVQLLKEQAEIEGHLRKSSKSNKEALERQDKIAKELDVLIAEQAGENAKAEALEKQAGEIKVREGQTEMRLNDIAAELAAYGNAEIEVLDEDVEKMEKEASVFSAKIEALGNVNLKAPQDYEEKAQSVNEATEKVNTLEGERRAVLSMIEEIDSKKLNAFITTYNEVGKNFSKLYNYVYPGKAHIELEDMNDPLNTGLSIRIEDPNFVGQSRGLSGGQKSLISLMLLFAIHMCKPAAVYLFDEIDTALDKENSKKLSQLIKEMAKEAQFIVVSHNDSLIVNADAALGVTKSGGDSQVFGIEISSMRKQ